MVKRKIQMFIKIIILLLFASVAVGQPVNRTTLRHGGTGDSTAVGAQNNLGILHSEILNDTATTGQVLLNSPLKFTGDSNSNYHFYTTLLASSSTTTGIKIAFHFPSGSTLSAITIGSKVASDSLGMDIITTDSTASAAFIKYNGTGEITIQGMIKISHTSGLVQMLFTKPTSGTATIKALSFLDAFKSQ